MSRHVRTPTVRTTSASAASSASTSTAPPRRSARRSRPIRNSPSPGSTSASRSSTAARRRTRKRKSPPQRPDLPGKPQPDYMLGLIARGTGDTQAAIEAFSRVQRLDPRRCRNSDQSRAAVPPGAQVQGGCRGFSPRDGGRAVQRDCRIRPGEYAGSRRTGGRRQGGDGALPDAERQQLCHHLLADLSRAGPLRRGHHVNGRGGAARRHPRSPT